MRSIVTRLWNPAVAMIVCVTAGLGGAVAQAQDMPGAMYPGMMERGAMSCRMDEHIDGDLAYLKTVLKITEAQTPQWNVFAETFRADRDKRASLCKETMEQAREMRSASLLDALTMVEGQLSERLDSLRAMKSALQPLYASLTKEQKKTADEVMRGDRTFEAGKHGRRYPTPVIGQEDSPTGRRHSVLVRTALSRNFELQCHFIRGGFAGIRPRFLRRSRRDESESSNPFKLVEAKH